MNLTQTLWQVFIMAIVTYLVRMLPFVLFRKKISNIFIKSFFAYIPYAVLGAMTFPAILSSTGNLSSAIAGLVVALLLAFFERGLLTVAMCSCGAVILFDLVHNFFL